MQVIFVILLHIDYTLNAKYEIFLKYLLYGLEILGLNGAIAL